VGLFLIPRKSRRLLEVCSVCPSKNEIESSAKYSNYLGTILSKYCDYQETGEFCKGTMDPATLFRNFPAFERHVDYYR